MTELAPRLTTPANFKIDGSPSTPLSLFATQRGLLTNGCAWRRGRNVGTSQSNPFSMAKRAAAPLVDTPILS